MTNRTVNSRGLVETNDNGLRSKAFLNYLDV